MFFISDSPVFDGLSPDLRHATQDASEAVRSPDRAVIKC
jgi:hypothetical protein